MGEGVGIVRGGGWAWGRPGPWTGPACLHGSADGWLLPLSRSVCMYTTGRRARDPLSFIQKSQQIYRMYKHILLYRIHVYLQCNNYVE
jgi:hypothetical protein